MNPQTILKLVVLLKDLPDDANVDVTVSLSPEQFARVPCSEERVDVGDGLTVKYQCHESRARCRSFRDELHALIADTPNWMRQPLPGPPDSPHLRLVPPPTVYDQEADGVG